MFFLDFSRFNAPALNIAHDENGYDNDEMKMIKRLAQSINEDAPVYILFIALGGIIFLPLGGLLFEGAIGYLWVVYLTLLFSIHVLYFWAANDCNPWFWLFVIGGSLGLFLILEWVGLFLGFFLLPFFSALFLN